MFPKFDDVAMSTYLRVLAKIRRPSMTPSASTPRSLSNRTMSAASLATSAAESTEIPTSAACSATASLTPSPRNATSTPDRRAILMMRDFCSGLTRANTVVCSMAEASVSSSRVSSSWPPTTPSTARPMSLHTLVATVPLSPVMTLTAMPSWWSLAMAAPASALGRSTKLMKPTRCRSCSSVGPTVTRPGASRTAIATTRAPSAKCASSVAAAPGATAMQRASTASGAPLVTSCWGPPGGTTRTDASCRS